MANRWGHWKTLFLGGSIITADGDCSHEIERCWLLGRKVMTTLDSILKSRDTTLPTRVHLIKTMVFPVVMYGHESWTVKKAECQKIDAFELWCWRRLLRVPWTARRSYQSILKETCPGYSLEGLMRRLKLQYFGHLMGRVDSLEKTLILGGIEGRRRRGRQRMRWMDGITDSLGMSLSKLWQLVIDRKAWHAVIHRVAKSQTRLSDWTELMVYLTWSHWNNSVSWECPAERLNWTDGLSNLITLEQFRELGVYSPHFPHQFSLHIAWRLPVLCCAVLSCPGMNTGVDCCALLQGIFPTQRSNRGLPHWRKTLYHLSHQGNSRIWERVNYAFSKGTSQPRNWTGVSCIAGRFFTMLLPWAAREVWRVPTLQIESVIKIQKYISPAQTKTRVPQMLWWTIL